MLQELHKDYFGWIHNLKFRLARCQDQLTYWQHAYNKSRGPQTANINTESMLRLFHSTLFNIDDMRLCIFIFAILVAKTIAMPSVCHPFTSNQTTADPNWSFPAEFYFGMNDHPNGTVSLKYFILFRKIILTPFFRTPFTTSRWRLLGMCTALLTTSSTPTCGLVSITLWIRFMIAGVPFKSTVSL